MPTLDLPLDPPLRHWPHRGHVAILDLEYTAWEGSHARDWGGPSEWREIVDVGCVVVDSENQFDEVEAFETLVKPVRNPILSDYFSNLTGIQQQDIESRGVDFPRSVRALAKALDGIDTIIFNGYDGRIIRENCEMHQIAFPLSRERMFNFRPLLAETLDAPASSLTSSELPKLAGVTLEGQAHSALFDCRAIARAFATWRRAGVL